MTNDEKIIVLADGLNQLCMKLDKVVFDAQNLSGYDLTPLRKDLLKIRETLVDLIPE